MDTPNNAGISNEQAIHFAGSELGARRHICGFFRTPEEEYRLRLPFIVPPDEFVRELRERRTATDGTALSAG